VFGERCTLLIIRDAFYGVARLTDFRAHLEIPSAVLTERLRLLVEAELRRPVRSPPSGLNIPLLLVVSPT
jgi:DNA-binding HxlR family transcriptional regulator